MTKVTVRWLAGRLAVQPILLTAQVGCWLITIQQQQELAERQVDCWLMTGS